MDTRDRAHGLAASGPVENYIMSVSWFAAVLLILLQLSPGPADPLTADVREALDRISADSLRGHLSFIASDSLEGRGTPSRGLDLAAEYLAAQFRRAGLEPAGDDDYFQTARFVSDELDSDEFQLKLFTRRETISVENNQISLSSRLSRRLTLSRARLVKVAPSGAGTSRAFRGAVIITELGSGGSRAEIVRQRDEFLANMRELKPALVIVISRTARPPRAPAARLVEADAARAPDEPSPVVITVSDSKLARLYDSLHPGITQVRVSARSPAVSKKSVTLRNVVGLLRGSDPVLRDTYILVTAHYDHLGLRAVGEGDRIYNGANDDGSGTVSVVELASALASLKKRPLRSVVFMAFFGEERGLLGSRYYGRNPIFPIEKTVANINLEQVGRTDSPEGSQQDRASLTGFDFSEVGDVMRRAGELTGITVYNHPRNSDAYFSRSDNQALADLGVPAHTLCVAYTYPDYHGVGDHWDKIDYSNMARVNRMIGLAVLMIANNRDEPRWNESNPKAARYVKAWKERQAR